jgi:hypothetical protein
MVVGDFYFIGIGAAPLETNSVLIVNSYAVLAPSASMQLFEPVSRRDIQVVECAGAIEHG